MSNSSRFILSLDLGTTGVRALLYRSNGKIAANAYSAFTQYFPKPGWVEHDAEEIFTTLLKMIRRACLSAGCDFSDIAAIGITNQRETVVLWDASTGKPVARAIVWQDRRTEKLCNELKRKGLESAIRKKTGLVLDPYFSATKINWLLKNTPGLRKKAVSGKLLAGTIDSWVLWKLTGAHATDPTNASRTLLFDIHRKCWDTDLLKVFKIPRALLPEVLPSGAMFGRTKAIKNYITAGVPVHAILGDQQAALYGQSCVRAGEVKNTYGTGCFMMMNAGTRRPQLVKGLLVTLASNDCGGPVYAYEGAVFIGGAVIQWLRDELGLIETAEESEGLALSVSDTHGMTLIPAFAGLGSPYWRADIRGTAFGMTRGVARAHFVRAALESIAHQSTDVLEAMRNACRAPIREMRTDGKAALNGFLMQFQADSAGLKILASSQPEVTAWGVAHLAGNRIGFWKPGVDSRKILSCKAYKPRWSLSKRKDSRTVWNECIKSLLASAAR